MKRPITTMLFLLFALTLGFGASAYLQQSDPSEALAAQAKRDDAKADEDDSAPDWQAIFEATPQAEIPAKLPALLWRDNLSDALAEAKKANRPLLVTIRCLPCKQCSGFDETVFEAQGELRDTLQQFVTVRITNMKDLDKRVLPYHTHQDLDVSWWGYFLSPEGGLYGVYGGIDAEGDTTRISGDSLKNAMDRVLNFHYDDRRATWNADPQAPDLSADEAPTPLTEDGYESFIKRDHMVEASKECLHCHHVAEILRQPEVDAGKFDKSEDFYVWPYPENLGLTLDRDHGLKVNEVEDKSPADKAGLKKGDVVMLAQDTMLFSQTDLRQVLQNLEGDKPKLELGVLRNGGYKSFTLKLKEGWRESDIGWRKSVAEADVGAHYGFGWPLKTNANERKGRKIKDDVMCIKPWFPKGATGRAADAGMKANDFVIAVDGESPDLFGRAFLVWFRLRYEAGDTIELTLVNPQGNTRKIKYEVAKKWDE